MILALDLATTTGVAFGPPCAPPQAWDFTMEGDHGERFAFYDQWLRKQIKTRGVEIIAFEAPFVGAYSNSKQRQKRNADTVKVLYGLRAITIKTAVLKRIPYREMTVSKIREHFIGHGGLKSAEAKKRVLERCRALGWDARTHDQADACAVWSAAASAEKEAHGKWTMEIGDAR